MVELLYHYAGIKPAPGSVIEPGNWGRMRNRYVYSPQDPTGGWRLAFELLMEQHRVKTDPTLASRLTSCFVFETLDHAREASQAMNGHWNVLYEVQLVEPSARVHRADLSLISAWAHKDDGLPAPFADRALQIATAYWRGVVAGTPELVTASPLRVGRVVG